MTDSIDIGEDITNEKLDELITEFILTIEDGEIIKSLPTAHERKETYSKLREIKDWYTLHGKEESELTPDHHHKIKLQKWFKMIVNDTTCTREVMDLLIQDSAVSMEEYEKICNNDVTQENNRKLVSILIKKAKKAFDVFLSALQDGGYAELAHMIQTTETTTNDINLYNKGIQGSKVWWDISKVLTPTEREHIKTTLKKWKDEDVKFISTESAEMAIGKLQKENCVTITGSSGCGKTFVMHHTALEMNKKGYYIIPIKKATEIKKYLINGLKVLFVVDDLCGNITLRKDVLMKWKDNLDQIRQLLDATDSKIVATCRLQVFKDQQFEHIDLFSSSECCLKMTTEEKMKIANKYSIDFQLDISKTPMANLDCFPLLCRMMEKKTSDEIKALSDNPFSFLKGEIKKYLIEGEGGRLKYCGLLLCVLLNNSINLGDLVSNNDRFRKIIDESFIECRLNRGTAETCIKDAIITLEGTFITTQEDRARIFHDKLFHLFAEYFLQNHPIHFLRNANSAFLKERCIVLDNETEKEEQIRLSDNYVDSYIERVCGDFKKEGIHCIIGNINFQSESFLRKFTTHVNSLMASTIKTLVTQQENGKIPLCEACGFGTANVVKWMLSIKANNSKSQGDSQSDPLLDINMRDANGNSPLHYACMNGNLGVLEELLQHEALQSDIQNNNKESALYVACFEGNVAIVKRLIEYSTELNSLAFHCIGINTPDNKGRTPLFAACFKGYIDIAKCILRQPSVEVNLCDIVKCSALSAASLNGHLDIVEELLKHPSIDVNIRDSDNRTALSAASLNGHLDIVEELLKHPSIDVNIRDLDNRTAADVAEQNGHAQIKTLLNSRT